MSADPSDAAAAFAEYAADSWWVASHLTQLAGAALIVAALLVLGHQLETEGGVTWARLGSAGAIASLATAAALQAVDGIALKALVDTWAAAPPEQKAMAFHAALAARPVAHTGFSAVAMTASMPASALVLTWMVILGVFMWRGTEAPGR